MTAARSVLPLRLGSPMLIAATLLGVAGLIALAQLALGGAEPRWRWGYVAAAMSVVLSAGQTAPLLSLTSRIGRGFWGAPLRRAADVLGLTGLISAPLGVLLLARLPDWQGRPSLWFDWPAAPGLWDSLALVGLALAGAALVWLVTWPERGGWGWLGTPAQWRVLTRAIVVLGSLYAMLLVFVQLLIVADLAMSLVPGWHSAVIPPYHVASAFEAAIALVVLLTHATGRLDARLARSSSKLLLSLGLFWFYFTWCELLTLWYGRTPDEQGLLGLFMFGPAFGLFIISAICNFLVPLVVLMWNRARGSPTAVSVVSSVVLVGIVVDRIRLFLPAWTMATPTPVDHLPERLPPLAGPGLAEALASLGVLALASIPVLLTLRRSERGASWEMRAVARLTPERRVLRTRTVVVARPS